MATYRFSSPALRDIDQIWDYYATRADAEVARQQVSSLNERFQLLSEYPYIGIARSNFAPELRSYTVPRTQYIIFYFPMEYGVLIARVAHGRRNIPSLFENPSNN